MWLGKKKKSSFQNCRQVETSRCLTCAQCQISLKQVEGDAHSLISGTTVERKAYEKRLASEVKEEPMNRLVRASEGKHIKTS